MSPDQYGQQAFNDILYGVQAVQQARDQSLRQRAFVAQQERLAKEFDLQQQRFGFEQKRFDFETKVQGLQMKVAERQLIDADASNAVMPHLANAESELMNLMDPQAIRAYRPDDSFINELPPEQQGRARALFSTSVQKAKDQKLASSGLEKLTRETAENLNKNSYLLKDPMARLEAQDLSYKMLAGAPLDPEGRDMLGRFLREIEAAKPLSATEISAYGKVYESNLEQETSILKEYAKEMTALDNNLAFMDRDTNPETQKKYEEQVSGLAQRYGGLISKARSGAKEMKDLLLGQRESLKDKPEAQPTPAVQPQPEQEKPKARTFLPPLKPSERNKQPVEDVKTQSGQEAATTQPVDEELGQRKTISQEMNERSGREKERLQAEYDKLASVAPYSGRDKVRTAAETARKEKLAKIKEKLATLP